MERFGLTVAEQPTIAGQLAQTQDIDRLDDIQRRYTRWSQFDTMANIGDIGKHCWLDHETGRLVFTDAGANPNR